MDMSGDIPGMRQRRRLIGMSSLEATVAAALVVVCVNFCVITCVELNTQRRVYYLSVFV